MDVAQILSCPLPRAAPARAWRLPARAAAAAALLLGCAVAAAAVPADAAAAPASAAVGGNVAPPPSPPASGAAALDAPGPAPAAPAGSAASAAADIVLVTVDTLRGDMPGYAGGPARTPALDALAARSWRFDRCIAAAMLTNPAHAALLTGRYPRDHGVYDNDSGIAAGLPTLATQLAAAGYHTGAVVNFRHLNPEVAGLGAGFGRFVRAGRRERPAAEVTAAGLQLLAALPRPAFVWLHYTDPHAPYEPPAGAELRPQLWPGLPPLAAVARAAPRFQRDNPWFAQLFGAAPPTATVAARYVAEVEAVDAALGALVAGLTAAGRADARLVITADHGENLGERDLFFHHGGLYDSTVHVPLLVHVPGAGAAHIRPPVAAVDVAPTVLELAAAAPLPGAVGQSLAALVRGTAAPAPFAFSEHMLGQQAAVRSNTGTLIVHRRDSRQFPTYPMRAGRREVLPPTLPAPDRQALEAALEAFLAPPRTARARPAPPDNREALRSLGYVDG